MRKDTGNLFKGIKRGKPYKYVVNDSMSVRVYAGSPAFHAHLLNNGHRVVDRSGKEHGFKKGYFFFEEGVKMYEDEYEKETEEFLDELLYEHGLY